MPTSILRKNPRKTPTPGVSMVAPSNNNNNNSNNPRKSMITYNGASKKRKVETAQKNEKKAIEPLSVDFNFFGYDNERSQLIDAIATLLKHSQSSSIVICGDSGSGKSYLVDFCLHQFTNGEYQQEYEDIDLVVFRFDGKLHGKNDLATIRCMGRKLNEYVGNNRKVDIADENSNDEEEDVECDLSTKVSNSIPKVVAQFHYLIEHRPNFRAIIVLDNIEVFCRRQQTLLYNLLDLTQHQRSILLLGLTQRLDFVDLLEKRVRSRLSQRIIHLVSPFANLKMFQNYYVNLAKTTFIGNKSLWSNMTKERADELHKQMEKCFHNNRNFNEINRMVQLHLFEPTMDEDEDENGKTMVSSCFIFKDPKIVSTCNLTRNELILLLLAAKQLKNLQAEAFTCRQLLAWSLTQVKHPKSLQMPQIIKAVYKMLELDLIIVATGQAGRRGQYSITPWVNLALNISDIQLKDMLDGLGSNLPNYIKQLLN